MTTCHCCSDIDRILYTEISYQIYKKHWQTGLFAVPEKDLWHSNWIQNRDGSYLISKPYAKASAHLEKISAALGKNLVISFDDYQ